ncbi:MAG: hypothetical protein SXV54_19605 [Chloroflexota bacterium]|nr:hypothetical protein [Chloroflexota bacterium]
MAEKNGQVLYHKCGAMVIQDPSGTFRTHDSDPANASILVCPICGAVLRDRDLYATKSDIARDKLRDIGWYPDPDGLALMDDPKQRASILSTLQGALDSMGDADLLAIYAVAVALKGEGE